MKIEMIRSWEIKSLYGIAAKGDLLDRHADEDDLHVIVRTLTGKESIKKLTRSEYLKVYHEIKRLVDGDRANQDRIDQLQIDKAWALMYEIIELSRESKASAGKRMCGAIKKICQKDAHPQDPFRFLSGRDLWRLIEQLKRYVVSLEKRQRTKGGDADETTG